MASLWPRVVRKCQSRWEMWLSYGSHQWWKGDNIKKLRHGLCGVKREMFSNVQVILEQRAEPGLWRRCSEMVGCRIEGSR